MVTAPQLKKDGYVKYFTKYVNYFTKYIWRMEGGVRMGRKRSCLSGGIAVETRNEADADNTVLVTRKRVIPCLIPNNTHAEIATS